MPTARQVSAFLRDHGWDESDANTRRRGLIEANLIRKSVGGRGKGAEIELREAILQVLSLGAPSATGAAVYVKRLLNFVCDGERLVDVMVEDAKAKVTAEDAFEGSITDIRLPIWAGDIPPVEVRRRKIDPERLRAPRHYFFDSRPPRRNIKYVMHEGIKWHYLKSDTPMLLRWCEIHGNVLRDLGKLFVA